MLKIITVCGLGVGSSLILKMSVEKAMKQLEKDCTIEHWDMGTIKGVSCDMIVTTESFRKNFSEDDNVVYVGNIMDVNDIKQKIIDFLDK